jgi:tetratricopeptide (TPR) repeat protein
MKKWILCLAVVMVASASFGAKKKQVDTSRLGAIWQAAQTRMNNQSDIWFQQGDYPRTTNVLRFMSEFDHGDYFSNADLGYMLENMHMYDEALAVYVKFRKENPKMPDAPFPEAEFYFTRKAYSKVPPIIEPTIASHPHPNSYRLLAHAYERLGLYKDALRIWKAHVAIHPEDLMAKNSLAKVEKRLAGTPGTTGASR